MEFNRRKVLAAGAGVATVAATSGIASAEPAAPVLSDAALARSLAGGFCSDHAAVNGTRLHYVAGGQGAPLILLPGWPETWWQFRTRSGRRPSSGLSPSSSAERRHVLRWTTRDCLAGRLPSTPGLASPPPQ
jgi:hypothetical protein